MITNKVNKRFLAFSFVLAAIAGFLSTAHAAAPVVELFQSKTTQESSAIFGGIDSVHADCNTVLQQAFSTAGGFTPALQQALQARVTERLSGAALSCYAALTVAGSGPLRKLPPMPKNLSVVSGIVRGQVQAIILYNVIASIMLSAKNSADTPSAKAYFSNGKNATTFITVLKNGAEQAGFTKIFDDAYWAAVATKLQQACAAEASGAASQATVVIDGLGIVPVAEVQDEAALVKRLLVRVAAVDSWQSRAFDFVTVAGPALAVEGLLTYAATYDPAGDITGEQKLMLSAAAAALGLCVVGIKKCCFRR